MQTLQPWNVHVKNSLSRYCGENRLPGNLGGPEQLGQFPLGQGPTREFSDRPSARQRFFERHFSLLLRQKSQDTSRTERLEQIQEQGGIGVGDHSKT